MALGFIPLPLFDGPYDAQLAATETPDAAAITANITLSATLAATEAADTASLTANVIVYATLAATETADTAAVSGTVILYTALASTEARDRAAIVIGPAWPATLPNPTIAGYALKLGPGVLRQPMEMGAARAWRRSRPLPEVAVVWQVDGWQQMLVDGIYESVTGNGAVWFGVTLALPTGLVLVSARFKDQLSAKSLGGDRWQVTATLELLSRPDSLSEAALTALLDDDGEEPAWPTALLPQPLASSWELQPKPEVIRSEDLPGLPQQRRRSRDGVMNVSASWELTAEQAPIFDAFFRFRGNDGARWFEFPLRQGIGLNETKIRFIGDTSWTPRAGGGWNVSAPIEVRERQVMTVTEYYALVGEDEGDLFEIVERLGDMTLWDPPWPNP